MLPLAMALGVTVPSMELFVFVAAPQVVAQSPVVLKLRRLGDRVDVVVNGLSADARVVSQSSSRTEWRGQLRAAAPLLLRGSQEVALAEAGLQSISLSANQQGGLALVVKASQGMALPDPMIRVDGNSLIVSFSRLPIQTTALTSGRLDLSRPGRVAQPTVVPPIRPRAVAPPLGDMAVGTMVLQNRSFVNASGPPVTLNLNNTPAKDALMALARVGGYGFVYVRDDASSETEVTTTNVSASSESKKIASFKDKLVTLSFKNESYGRALSGILLASDLQAKLEGRTLFVGPSVFSKTFGPQMSKVIRLNQVSATSAAEYLGNLGATFNRTNTTTTTSGEAASAGTTQLSNQTSQTTSTTPASQKFGSESGPLLGLVVTNDDRLQTVTLVGDSQLVSVAEAYLKKIDLRQRQVALSVRILDISLENDSQLKNSFAFRSGNAFIVSDQGQLLANFGSLKPPGNEEGGLPSQYSAQSDTTPLSGTGALREGQGFLDQPQSPYPFPGSPSSQGGPYRPGFGTKENILQPGVTEIDDEGKITYTPPTRFQYPSNQLFDFLVAQIQSSNTKILASPTLIIQEGGEIANGNDQTSVSIDGKVGRERSNESLVSVGRKLVTNYNIVQDRNGNAYCKPVFSNSGLTFGARVDKIDDNGFVTFSLSPEISAAVGTPQIVGNCGTISTISSRSLDTGKVRVRDGQTLILTGVISDADIQVVTKWPLLGDIPIIGQFFRSSGGNRSKNELVILVTPTIVDDNQGGNFGYGYKPSLPASRQILSDS